MTTRNIAEIDPIQELAHELGLVLAGTIDAPRYAYALYAERELMGDPHYEVPARDTKTGSPYTGYVRLAGESE